jgi:phosphoesterase RecJ-like protein
VKDEVRTQMDRAAAAIAAASSIAVTCHVSPDGDAIGSALGFAHAARRAGKQAVVSFGEPFVLPDQFDFLDQTPLVPPKEFPTEPEVLVVFDVASPDRLGSIAAAADGAGTVVIVDHHASNDGFGDIAVIDPTGAASAQLATQLIETLGWEIDQTTATALMVGIVTDTGRFQYSATDGDTLRVAARLLDAGVRPEQIGTRIYESAPFGYLKVSSAVLGRAELEEDLGLVWSVVWKADLKASGVPYEDLDGLMDDLRIAREAGTAALIKEVDGGFKVSLRSRGETDVGAIAVANGGGGHHNAAGFTAEGDLDGVLAAIRAGLGG